MGTAKLKDDSKGGRVADVEAIASTTKITNLVSCGENVVAMLMDL